MYTRYVSNPDVPGVCLHNTATWQVTELMGGLACEILYKVRIVDDVNRRAFSLPLHACFGTVFLQGDAASEFLDELREARARLCPKDIDRLLLSPYAEAAVLT